MADDDERPPRVQHSEREGRLEITIGGKTAGYAVYRDEGDVRVFIHTRIEPAFQGKGLGSRLAEAALDATRAAGLHVEPRCESIAAYIERHAEYADMLVRPRLL